MKMRLQALSLICLFCFFSITDAIATDNELCEQKADSTVYVRRGQRIVGEFSVILAASPAKYRKGLMHCHALAAGSGMLFLYSKAAKRTFWMKNTLIDLAIIFISENSRILSIEHGRAGSLKRITSPCKSRMVLEINYNESRHLAIGDYVHFQQQKRSP
jgi:uncharacterized membrane protein (UPF0127 family)